jgi:hypothetical protein
MDRDDKIGRTRFAEPPPPPGYDLKPREDKASRTWRMLAHLSALLGYVGVPLGWILGPLLVWLFKKNDYLEVDMHGREAMNFQISWFIWGIIAALSIFILIGFLLVPLIAVANIVLTIVGAVKADRGELYRYPLTIRFFK